MPRPVDERQGEVETPLHAAGVALHLAVGRLAQPDARQELVRALAALVAREPLQRRLQANVVAAGQERVERGLLERGADHGAHPRALLDDVVAADARGAGRRRQQRRQHQDGRRLACAVGAEEAVDLAGVDVEIDGVDRPRPLLELADEPLDLDRVVRSATAEPYSRCPSLSDAPEATGLRPPARARSRQRRQRHLRRGAARPRHRLRLDAPAVADVGAAVEARSRC